MLMMQVLAMTGSNMTIEERFTFLKAEEKRIKNELLELRDLMLAGVRNGDIKNYFISNNNKIHLGDVESFVKCLSYYKIETDDLLSNEIVLDKKLFRERLDDANIDISRISGISVDSHESLYQKKELGLDSKPKGVSNYIKKIFEI